MFTCLHLGSKEQTLIFPFGKIVQKVNSHIKYENLYIMFYKFYIEINYSKCQKNYQFSIKPSYITPTKNILVFTMVPTVGSVGKNIPTVGNDSYTFICKQYKVNSGKRDMFAVKTTFICRKNCKYLLEARILLEKNSLYWL